MGEDFNNDFNAATGQRGDEPREGIFNTFILSGDGEMKLSLRMIGCREIRWQFDVHAGRKILQLAFQLQSLHLVFTIYMCQCML